MHKSLWEIENIQADIENEAEILRKFFIYDDSMLIQSRFFKIAATDDFISEIKKSEIDTGIMVSSTKINGLPIFLFILDNRIFIIKQTNLLQFQEYFNVHLDLLMFMTLECKKNFSKAISSKYRISEQNDQILKDQKDINIAIKNKIIKCIIKKSQYRTIKMRQELLPNKYNSKNDQNYKLDDFFQIQSRGFYLYYNSKDQILNVLKFYEEEKRFKHEIDFYHQIENTFPFIRKIFGLIKQSNKLPIIIFEYVEGESLDNFLLSDKEIDFNTKIKMIEEILFSVYYIHSNVFYLRDLKPDNIIIDSQNDAILIDFDLSKEMYSPNEEENTGNIGDPVFTAPEQLNSNDYTYKVDSYSIGMIIHFIITRQKIDFSYYGLSEIYKRKESISKHNKFPKLPKEHDFFLNIYEKCFETSPNLRPSIATLMEKMIIDNDNDKLEIINETELPNLIKKIEKYESIFKIADKYMHEKPIERSYLKYFLGYVYYYGCYVSVDINKAITQLEKASIQNNSDAQYYLGKIYYFDEYIPLDINKSIHYFTLSANQNHSYAQYLLGEIYYSGQYISRDINKSIHYLILSSNQNNSDSQYLLGEIYYLDQYISRDINKSIHYLTLSANQNHSYAQFYLGEIYFLGQFVSRDINKSIQYLTLSANQNNPKAEFLLGFIYYLGRFIPRDINKSIYYLTLSANQNNSYAQFFLGKIYYFDKNIPHDINKSIHFLTLSAFQNHSDAQFYLGKIYYYGHYISRDINKSIYYLTLSANQNNQDAEYLLGFIYYSGQYISRDIKKSIYYLTLSASQNNSDSQCLLGVIYYFDKNIPHDINKAIHFLTLSANQNHSYAQFYLGKIYYLGQHIAQDINKSIHYLALSANQNNSDAQFSLGEIYYTGKFISRDINKSIHYLTLSSNKNNPNAQYLLGVIYYLGKYISRDINKSIHYLTLLANQNNFNAQFLLGTIYYLGEYISQNINKSIQYLTLSANQYHSDAQYYLGVIYYLGKYISRDINKSIHYLTLSANQNNSKAQCILGEIYYNGKYIEKDIEKAIHYFKESSSFNNNIAKNYLGIIYKNGDGVERNIYFAKVYFKEAIKQKEESYSMYNLARIYYFGIGQERKISKAISLLEQASKRQLFIADIFLYYIFSNCDNEIFLDLKKSQKCKNKCQNHFSHQISCIIFNDHDNIQNLQIFLKDYDLIHYYNFSYDLIYFLLNGKFNDWKTQINDNLQLNNESLRKDINADFYEGFNN